MRLRHLLPALLFAVSSAAQIPTPSEHLKIQIGADRVLADWGQITSYFQTLDSASPRVELETLGKSTQGRDMVMAVISSEENLRNKARIKEIAARLADPRGLTDAQLDALVREGKTIVLVTCNIHSTEIASSQMAMEWAHALATAEDAETKRRLDNVVLLLVPSLNPDGQQMITDWYRKHLGTRYEASPLPWLYHQYVGHDNNRDWFMLTQVETKHMNRAIYRDWHPQLFVDEHQMGSEGPRMFIPPFADPVDPDVHPLIWREVNIIGANMAHRLEQKGKSGLIYGYAFDAYWMGGTRNTGWWKNITGLLLEVASARIATPIYIEPNELSGDAKGLIDYKATVNHPNPWRGGWWRLRDIMDYERIASDALHEIAADRREDFLRGVATRARAAVASAGAGEGFVIPREQRDWPTAQHLAALLQEHGVEVRVASNGDYWVPLAQPYSRFIVELLETQRYPETRVQSGADILRPYDVASWTLPLQMGVTVRRGVAPAGETLPVAPPITPERKDFVARGAALPRQPRVATLKPWTASMDEGWTRWVLETYGVKSTALTPQQFRAKNGLSNFDAIILPDLTPDEIRSGARKRGEDAMRYSLEMPPEYRGGIAPEGTAALVKFVENGGTLIAFNESCDFVISEFNIPVRNVLRNAKSSDFSVPGSLLRVNVRPDHPVTAGLPAETAVFLDSPIAFETTAPGAEMERWVLASYPEETHRILMSGWIHGAAKLSRNAAAVATTYGKGKIVLLGFRPQHRGQTHATFPFLFNALWWSVK